MKGDKRKKRLSERGKLGVKTHWLSIRKVWTKAYGIGMFFGIKKDDAPCIILAIWNYAIFIGPHIHGGEPTS